MTIEEAGPVTEYAKGLFPVTSQARIDAMGVMLLDFPNPAFARQCLMEHAKTADVLSIPTVRAMLEAEEGRQREYAERQRAAVTSEVSEHRRRRNEAMARYDVDAAKVDALLADLDDADLETLKAEVVKQYPFMAKGDPKTHRGLRVEMFVRLSRASPPPREPESPRVFVPQVQELSFDE